MSRYSDQDYLRSKQYKDAAKLNARIALHRRFSTNPQNFYRWIFDHLHLEARQHILELGCGSGDLWRDNLDRLPAGCQITLTDFSSGMLSQARMNLAQSRSDINFVNLDAQHIPFRTEHFDIVIANFMIYHIPDRSMALSDIHRVLKPEGHLFAATNGEGHLRELRELVQKIAPDSLREHPATAFNLENGTALLSRFFSKVRIHRFEDSLLVTEVQPLVSYIRSMDYSPEIDKRPEQVAQLIESRIQEQGALFIHKSPGMFEAIRENKIR
jgi:SAM-dependent methyltransferase